MAIFSIIALTYGRRSMAGPWSPKPTMRVRFLPPVLISDSNLLGAEISRVDKERTAKLVRYY